MTQIATPFFIALGISFASAVPFGPVNLSVMETALRHNRMAGLRMAAAAAFMESCQVLLALLFSKWISQWFTDSPWVKVVAMIVFIGLGLFFFFQHKFRKTRKEPPRKSQQVLAGVLVNIANPQVLPFWVVMFTWLAGQGYLELNSSSPWALIGLFMLGIFLGKGSALSLYSLFSDYIRERSTTLAQNMNRIIGGILIVIGLFQGVSAWWQYY